MDYRDRRRNIKRNIEETLEEHGVIQVDCIGSDDVYLTISSVARIQEDIGKKIMVTDISYVTKKLDGKDRTGISMTFSVVV